MNSSTIFYASQKCGFTLPKKIFTNFTSQLKSVEKRSHAHFIRFPIFSRAVFPFVSTQVNEKTGFGLFEIDFVFIFIPIFSNTRSNSM